MEEFNALFQKKFHREPLQFKTAIVLDNLSDLKTLCSNLKKEEKHITVGFDSEHMSNPKPWCEIEKEKTKKFYKPYDDSKCGPYVRTLQFAFPDGNVIVIDINKVAINNEQEAFKEIDEIFKSINTLVCFSGNSDKIAVKLSFNISIDTSVEMQFTYYSLDSIILEVFGVELPKTPHYSVWKNDKSLACLEIYYCAMDALATLDLYLFKKFQNWKNCTKHLHETQNATT
jgi:hypothetical protein